MEDFSESHLKQKKHGRVVLFPIPLEGHLNPMLQLANILYTKGFSITIIHTHFNSPGHSNFPHFIFHPIAEGLSEIEASQYTDDTTRILNLINVTCVEPFRGAMVKLLSDENNSKEPITCLITDTLWSFIPVVLDNFKLPWLVLVTGNASSFPVAYAFPLLHEKGYMPCNSDNQLDDPVPDVPPLKVKDIPEFDQEFFPLICNMAKTAKASCGLIINTFEELEQSGLTTCREVFQIPVYHIGPLHKYFPASSNRASLLTQDHTAISWLDTQAPKSVLYVSFGSLVTIKESEFLEIAWGLANSRQPFLWVVRTGLIQGSKWIESLPNGFHQLVNGVGLIVKWAPQKEVLAHLAIGGFLTHCGWNSMLESTCEGVPMIFHPNYGDQKVNARFASDVWKVGIHLEYNIGRRHIERSIKALMEEVEGHEIRNTVASLKEKVNGCLRQGGSSYHSLDNLTKFMLST